jgi:RNA polymerase sigma-70 factor (ECF subfamily)
MATDPQPPDSQTYATLFDHLYPQLRAIATQHLTHLPAGGTLTPTVLVHEAYLRFKDAWSDEDRRHFLNAAGLAMRQILIDYLREKGSQKRGGGYERIPLEDDRISALPLDDALLDLDAAITDLAVQSEPAAQVVTLRFFAGAGWDEIAAGMDLPVHKVRSLWAFARAWLFRRLKSLSQ